MFVVRHGSAADDQITDLDHPRRLWAVTPDPSTAPQDGPDL